MKLLVWKARAKPNQIFERFLLISAGFGLRLYCTFYEYSGILLMRFLCLYMLGYMEVINV